MLTEEIREVKIVDPYGFIYITTNNINGKKYIGQCTFNRINNWKSYLGSGVYLKRAIKKYGKENFYKNIITIAYSKEKLDELEIEFIDLHNAIECDEYYNLVGGGNTTIGLRWSEESKNNLKGRKKTEETKRRMSESKKMGYKNGDLSNIRKVICITTKEIFDSITRGAEKYNVKVSEIVRCCKNKRKSAGKHLITKKKLKWMYYDEYILKSSTLQFDVFTADFYKIICLTTGEIFNSIKEAEKIFNICNGGISNCCRKKAKSAGKHPMTNEPLVWMYCDEYLLKTKDDIDNIVRNSHIDNRHKQVICLNTKEIFSSAVEASKKYDIDNSAITKCCRGKLKSAGKNSIDNNKMVWMYYEDYIK